MDTGHRRVSGGVSQEILDRSAAGVRLRLAHRPRFDNELQSLTVWNPLRASIDPEPTPIRICRFLALPEAS
jgi:hypothetical protein